jgi:hypothetical protein
MAELKTAEIVLEYQQIIPGPPMAKETLHQQACTNDVGTVNHWAKIWLDNIRANKDRYGSFKENSVAKFFGAYKYQPAIVAGSGPSLKKNAAKLKDRGGIPLISCLHNFHYFEDLELNPDFYVSLDAGDITIEEVCEGGSKTPDEYWALTKDRVLLCYIGTSPRLLEKWQGKVYFFNAPVPEPGFLVEQDKIEKFNLYFSSGGNVLGACLYAAKGLLGCSSVVFVGADFSFGYPTIKDGEAKHSFHSWKSKYDKELGRTIKVPDIFGNKVHTWQSYYNFKHYFDWFACHVGGEYINATEGGCLGAFNEGNISQFKYMDLSDALKQFTNFNEVMEPTLNPEVDYRKILY